MNKAASRPHGLGVWWVAMAGMVAVVGAMYWPVSGPSQWLVLLLPVFAALGVGRQGSTGGDGVNAWLLTQAERRDVQGLVNVPAPRLAAGFLRCRSGFRAYLLRFRGIPKRRLIPVRGYRHPRQKLPSWLVSKPYW